MALVIKDRIKELTTTTGTGAISLAGASASFDTFSSVMSDGDTTYYAIVHATTGTDEWEVGLGTYNSSGNTLTRTTVYSGSNGTSATDFGTGQKNVFITIPSSRTVNTDASGNVSVLTTDKLTEGSSNLYYTDARVNSHLSGGTGVTYNDGAISIGQDVSTTANVTFGNLTVNGTTTTVNSTTTTVDDPVFTIGGDAAPSSDDNKDRGIEFRYHNGTDAKVGFFGYDDSAGKFTFIPDATNSSEVFSGSAGTIVAALEGNATTATTLATARNIAGQSFDGSANISIAPTDLTGVTSTAAELNILDGVTSTTAELNILDGVTSTAAELNILDGVTSTAAELNILDGVTSTAAEINLLDGSTAGTIVNDKAVVYGSAGEVNATTLQVGGTAITATPAELNIMDGVTATTAELNIMDGVTSTAAELNLLDGVTATTAELNYLDITTLGTSEASKAVTADASNNVVLGGNVDIGAGADVTGNITVSGTVDGRDVAADGTKLDGIESGATADQTAAEIRTLVESASDSNVFTDADHTKLNGIEASADVTDTTNVTAAGALMDSELTNLAAVKAINQGLATTNSPTFSTLNATNVYGSTRIGLDSNDYLAFANNSRMDIYINGSNEFRFESDGDFHADGDIIAESTTTSSDERLKSNIKKVEDPLGKLELLNGVTFEWRKTGAESAGVIAQDVQKVLPQAVKEVKGFNGESHLTVNYPALTSILIESIKELKEEIEVLKKGKD